MLFFAFVRLLLAAAVVFLVAVAVALFLLLLFCISLVYRFFNLCAEEALHGQRALKMGLSAHRLQVVVHREL